MGAFGDEVSAKTEGDNSPAIIGSHNTINSIENQYVLPEQNIPIHFDPEDLLEIFNSFKEHIEKIDEDMLITDFMVITIEDKNEINFVSKGYYEDCIKESSPYFPDVNQFLTDPKNRQLKRAYSSCVNAIKRRIAAFNKNHQDFDVILEQVKGAFLAKLPKELNQKSRITSIAVDFMYCNCDIGKKEKL